MSLHSSQVNRSSASPQIREHFVSRTYQMASFGGALLTETQSGSATLQFVRTEIGSSPHPVGLAYGAEQRKYGRRVGDKALRVTAGHAIVRRIHAGASSESRHSREQIPIASQQPLAVFLFQRW